MAIDARARLGRRLLGSNERVELPEVVRTTGKVVAVNTDGSVDLSIRANPMPVEDVPTDSNYVPQLNDVVQVEITDGHPTVLGMEGNAILPPALRTVSFGKAAVLTEEFAGSLTYVDLATPGPTVSVTVGPSGVLLVKLGAMFTTTSDNDGACMSFTLSGANTLAAADENSILFEPLVLGARSKFGDVFMSTGLNPGLTTVTAKYRDIVDTGTDVGISFRKMWAVSW